MAMKYKFVIHHNRVSLEGKKTALCVRIHLQQAGEKARLLKLKTISHLFVDGSSREEGSNFGPVF